MSVTLGENGLITPTKHSKPMNRQTTKLLTGLATLVALALSTPQTKACTDLIVGKGASTDGSVIISYAADSHTLYGELYFWPRATWMPGYMMDVVEWDSGIFTTQIPQVANTYNVVGNLNEKQVAITESTWGGIPECQGTEGLMDYGSLIYITLQRAATAREAISTLTGLVAKYGYKSSGESFTIADKNEVWVLEMIGKGKGETGAVWVAKRIPDNAISGHANQARIQQIDFDDPENCLYSPDVITFARQKGLYSGSDKDFSFQKVYNPYDFGGLRGCEARVWAFFNRHKKGMDRYLPLVMGHDPEAEPMPLYIIPDHKLSVHDVQEAMRDHYESTPMDMTKDVGAGPYCVPYRWRPMGFEVDGQKYINERAIATQQTGFVLVAQLRSTMPDLVGPILWFGVDDANTTVFSPMYGCITRVPEAFSPHNGSLTEFSWTSAFWIHNWVANMAYSKYSYMIQDIRPVQQEIESKYFADQPLIEKEALRIQREKGTDAARAYLTNYSEQCANNATQRWKKLGEYLLVKYIDGNVKREENGHFKTEHGLAVPPEQPGYSEEYYRMIHNGNYEHLKVPKK